MTEGTWLAIVAAVSALAMLWVTAAIARRVKREDYARQDQLSERLEKIGVKTEQIHGLVNSSMTAAIQGKLVAEKALYVLQAEKSNPSKKQVAEMAATAARIVDIEAILKERIKADEDAKAVAELSQESEATAEEKPIDGKGETE